MTDKKLHAVTNHSGWLPDEMKELRALETEFRRRGEAVELVVNPDPEDGGATAVFVRSNGIEHISVHRPKLGEYAIVRGCREAISVGHNLGILRRDYLNGTDVDVVEAPCVATFDELMPSSLDAFNLDDAVDPKRDELELEPEVGNALIAILQTENLNLKIELERLRDASKQGELFEGRNHEGLINRLRIQLEDYKSELTKARNDLVQYRQLASEFRTLYHAELKRKRAAS